MEIDGYLSLEKTSNSGKSWGANRKICKFFCVVDLVLFRNKSNNQEICGLQIWNLEFPRAEATLSYKGNISINHPNLYPENVKHKFCFSWFPVLIELYTVSRKTHIVGISNRRLLICNSFIAEKARNLNRNNTRKTQQTTSTEL